MQDYLELLKDMIGKNKPLDKIKECVKIYLLQQDNINWKATKQEEYNLLELDVSFKEWLEDDYIPKTITDLDITNLLETLKGYSDYKKSIREEALNNLTIEVSSGKVFNADEKSISRMQNALKVADEYKILSGVELTTTNWILYTNEKANITIQELREAYVMASLQFSNEFLKYS